MWKSCGLSRVSVTMTYMNDYEQFMAAVSGPRAGVLVQW